MSGNLERSTCDSCTRSILRGSYCESSKGAAWAWLLAVTPAAPPKCIPDPVTIPIPYSHWRRLITYLLRLVPRLEHWGGAVRAPRFPTDRTMPHATAECRDVDLFVVQRIGNHPVSPLEVKAGNTAPVQPAVCRSPSRRFQASGVDHIGGLRVNGDVVNVAILVEHLRPALAAILREKNPSAISVFSGRSSPGGEVKTIWRLQIGREAIRSIRSCRQRNGHPVLRSVGRPVQGTVSRIADASILRSSCYHHV